uniref:H15 domain-containing protein n=1 Tax=Sphenodon punctatus TaxID=8508 RepID=A0A8D0HT51_SPHPU
MTETAPAPAASKAPAKKAKKATGAAKARKAPGPSVAELLTQAVSASKERSGVSLAALKKALAAAGYDVEKNNSRIKVGLKSLVSKGTLVQIKGTGASGSFKLNKKQAEKSCAQCRRGASPCYLKPELLKKGKIRQQTPFLVQTGTYAHCIPPPPMVKPMNMGIQALSVCRCQ